MTSPEANFILHCADPDSPAPALVAVDIDGHLDGLLLSLTLAQTYVNRGTEPIEVQYSFPLPHGAVLLSMAASFGTRRIEAEVLPKRQAETRYEDALDNGHAPVLLELAAGGLHTASLGNLAPGESVKLDLSFAQLQAPQQGRLRLAILTTMAPRYGLPQSSGVQAHQVPDTSLLVSYPLTLRVAVARRLGNCDVMCSSHAHRLETTPESWVLGLAPGAVLDRDVVLQVTSTEPWPNILTLGVDAATVGAPVVALASFALPPQPPLARLSLRLLLDCSGSMAGDSISATRRAVRSLLRQVGKQDRVSLSCFGDTCEHLAPPSLCDNAHLELLREQLRHVDANMGGTEIAHALQEVFKTWKTRAATGDGSKSDGSERADVLVITDGEAWPTPALLQAAARSGHRVFAIGVGAAPAEDVLRELAEATGGACEFVTPGEDLEQAVLQMLQRMRQPGLAGLAADWGTTPVWSVPISRATSGGDTVLAMAGFRHGGEPSAEVRLLTGTGAALAEVARTEAQSPAPAELGRLAAARRLPYLAKEDAAELAVAHQLVSRHTHAVLVHYRADEERAQQPARLQRVQQMLAAGWGGTSRVTSSSHRAAHSGVHFAPPRSFPSVWRSSRANAAARIEAISATKDRQPLEIPAFLRCIANDYGSQDTDLGIVLIRLVTQVKEAITLHGDAKLLERHAAIWRQPAPLRALLQGLMDLGATLSQAWLILALWAAQQQEDAQTVLWLSAHLQATAEPAMLLGQSHLDSIPTLASVREDLRSATLTR